MEEIKKMSIQDKIRLLEYVRKTYCSRKLHWTREKVDWLESLIDDELKSLASFDVA